MLGSIDRLIRQAMNAAEKAGQEMGEKGVEAAREFGSETLFVVRLLAMPNEQAIEELWTKMQGADERTYIVLKRTITGMMRLAQMAEASGELSPFQMAILQWVSPKYLQTLQMYANYIDEIHEGKSFEQAMNATLLAGVQLPSISSQASGPEPMNTSAGWPPRMTLTLTSGPGQQFDAASPEQIIADFVTRRR